MKIRTLTVDKSSAAEVQLWGIEERADGDTQITFSETGKRTSVSMSDSEKLSIALALLQSIPKIKDVRLITHSVGYDDLADVADD